MSKEQVQFSSKLIQDALNRFDLAGNPQQALEFFVNSRGTLINSDQLQCYVILRLMALTLNVVRSVSVD